MRRWAVRRRCSHTRGLSRVSLPRHGARGWCSVTNPCHGGRSRLLARVRDALTRRGRGAPDASILCCRRGRVRMTVTRRPGVMSTARAGWRAELLFLARSNHDDLADGVVEQPCDVLGIESRPTVRRRGDHNPVKSLVRDRLPEPVAVRSPRLDPRIDGHPELRRSLLDRLPQRNRDRGFGRQRRVEWKVRRNDRDEGRHQRCAVGVARRSAASSAPADNACSANWKQDPPRSPSGTATSG